VCAFVRARADEGGGVGGRFLSAGFLTRDVESAIKLSVLFARESMVSAWVHVQFVNRSARASVCPGAGTGAVTMGKPALIACISPAGAL